MRYIHLRKFALLGLVTVFCLGFAVTASAKGKKYGLFVGINDYPGSDHDLRGAVNDAKNMKSLLETKYGFLAANDMLLTDNGATRAAILDGIAKLGAKAGAGDMLVIQYSGHGSLFPDKYSNELDETQKVELHVTFEDGSKYDIPLDYYDSAICPWDMEDENSTNNWGNMILDDELYAAFAPLTAKGVSVVFVSDSCHSGTVGKGKLKGKVRFMQPEVAFKGKRFSELHLSAPAGQKTVKARQMPGNYIALTAAKDNEFAMDSAGGSIPSGLFTTKLIAAIRASKTPLTYKRLITLVEPQVAETSLTMDNNQHPQLDGRFGNTAGTIFTLPK
jgi:hypothetical protein